MNHDELNEFIKNYLERDKTHSAILLTAPWGAGKSYYIQNELKPFLNEIDNCKDDYPERPKSRKKHNNPNRCLIVSLYGLNTISELSKELFLEDKLPVFLKKKKGKFIGAFAKPLLSSTLGIGKTILKSLTSINLDFPVNNPNWQQYYNSVDYSQKLIVLEDIERSGICIVELLGFVNSLVEQDGVKVLLVANENELIKHEMKSNIITTEQKNNDDDHREYTKGTQEYLLIKEKTVGDTIQFIPDREKAIKEILHSFENNQLNNLLTKSYNGNSIVADVVHIMEELKCDNFRSIIYGCQKTVDLLQENETKYDDRFIRSLFLGNIAFSLKMKRNDTIAWDAGNSSYSYTLGTTQYPLFRASFDFIKCQHYNKDAFDQENELFVESLDTKIKQDKVREYLDVIYHYYNHFERDVVQALEELEEKMKNTDDVHLTEYGKLSNFLISIKYEVGFKDIIDRIHKIMIKHLKGDANNVLEHSLMFHDGIELSTQEAKQELERWISEMISIINSTEYNYFDFDYKPESVNRLRLYCNDHFGEIKSKHLFAALFDIDKIIEMLRKSSPKQIAEFRSIFNDVYDSSNIGISYSNDKESLINLEVKIKALTGETEDKIIKLQLTHFVNKIRKWIDDIQ